MSTRLPSFLAHRSTEAETGTIVLMPVYNDWEACARLLQVLDDVLEAQEERAAVCVVDDGSPTGPGSTFEGLRLRALESVDVISLRANLGHQRAICVGLAYIEAERPCRTVVVMDSDGEDDPRDVPRLVEECARLGHRNIVFAERARRSEGPVFTLFYTLYRVVHRVLTGQEVRVGNFSALPFRRLRSLVVVPELWSHYAAAVFVSRQPRTAIPTQRATRLAGRSTMNFPALVAHGLTAVSVFSGTVAVRLLLALGVAILTTVVGIGAVVGVRLFTERAIPGWATYTVGTFLILLMQAVMFAFVVTFLILADRKGAAALPARDFRYFIDLVQRAYPAADSPKASDSAAHV